MNITLKSTLIIAAAIATIGLILAVIGFVAGGMQTVHIGSDGIKLAGKSENTVLLHESYKSITSIHADFDLRDVILKEGSGFEVESKGVGKDFNIDNSNGILTLKDNGSSGFSFNLFGFTDGTQYSDITITYPAGTTFEEIDINSDSGNITISDITVKKLILYTDLGDIELGKILAETAKANIDSGDINIEQTNIGSLQFELGLGDMNAKNFTGEKIDGYLNSGSVELEGTMEGPIELSSDLGDVSLILNGREDFYSYELTTDLGDINLNGQKSDGNMTKKYENKPLIRIDVDSGSVNIVFKKL